LGGLSLTGIYKREIYKKEDYKSIFDVKSLFKNGLLIMPEVVFTSR